MAIVPQAFLAYYFMKNKLGETTYLKNTYLAD
jgi:hypothetical protein